jgi:type II secretory ATPase GspE/PulE/Tfp pilus assembly ATPase PilB-like protein
LGYRGRIGVYEVMVVTDEMKGLILRRASVAEIGRAAEEGAWYAPGTTGSSRRRRA